MTTTELIKILQDNEKGSISHKSRQISLTVNGRYLPEPQITLLGTGDGVAGSEIDFDVDGEWFECEVDETDEVLNKIRSEIEKEIVPRNSEQYDYESKWQNFGLIMALKVINKYKAEKSKEET